MTTVLRAPLIFRPCDGPAIKLDGIPDRLLISIVKLCDSFVILLMNYWRLTLMAAYLVTYQMLIRFKETFFFLCSHRSTYYAMLRLMRISKIIFWGVSH